VEGQPCTAGSPPCARLVCEACSDQYWQRYRIGPCQCSPSGWACLRPPGTSPIDCFFDPPLECDLAQTLYEDAACTVHPVCTTNRQP
jgi:hypothetical protein